jgi:SAM-dependent methyltransferase
VNPVADAYSAGATAWAEGPARVYGRLAEELVAFSPWSLNGATVLDLGTGTGVGSRAAASMGARVVASDIALDMLRLDRGSRPPAVASDASALAFRSGAFDAVLAAFSLNHFDDPSLVIREMRRVAPLLLASTYANDDDHPVKHAAETALREHGWQAPHWYAHLKRAMRSWGTVEGAQRLVQESGLHALRIERNAVTFAELTPNDLVASRLGMAHIAPFVATLGVTEHAALMQRAAELLGPDPEPLVRTVVFVAAT